VVNPDGVLQLQIGIDNQLLNLIGAVRFFWPIMIGSFDQFQQETVVYRVMAGNKGAERLPECTSLQYRQVFLLGDLFIRLTRLHAAQKAPSRPHSRCIPPASTTTMCRQDGDGYVSRFGVRFAPP
jgi:hypothetical protein